MSQSFSIFGNAVEIETDNSPGTAILYDELSVYPSSEPHEPKLDVMYQHEDPRPLVAATNPSVHGYTPDRLYADFGTARVAFHLDKSTLTGVTFSIPNTSYPRAAFAKLRSSQFGAGRENIGQFFHELVAVPSMLLRPDRAVVHAAALMSPSGSTLLIGGTGGVGKSSLCLELCANYGFTFMADDITVGGVNGHVWPNLAFPKIYGYNVLDSGDAKARLLRGRSFTDRAHWNLHRLRGQDKVRRRLSPEQAYGGWSPTGAKLSSYCFISRESRADVTLERVGSTLMSSLSVNALAAEYSLFLNHLHWHEINARLQCKDPAVTVRVFLDRLRDRIESMVSGGALYVLRVPRAMSHTDFRCEVSKLLAETLT